METKSKLSAESVDFLKTASTLVGANKTSTLLDKTFNLVSLNISDVLDKTAIDKEINKNAKLDFLKNEKFVFRGTLTVKLFGDDKNTAVYLNNALLASLVQCDAITLKQNKDKEWEHTLSPKAVILSADKCVFAGK